MSTRPIAARREHDSDGFTLVELCITMGILLLVVATLLTQLSSAQNSEHFAAGRAAVLDQTRASMARMTKDVRQASSIDPTSSATHLAMNTYVDSATKYVTYDINGTNLLRTVTGKSPEILQTNLASDSIFTYEPDVSAAHVVSMLLQVMPPGAPETTIKLSSEARLRNLSLD